MDLRTIFDEDPERYDRARPGYPAELFGDLGKLADIGPGARVAEAGPGTGQATATLVASGADVVAVELGRSPPGNWLDPAIRAAKAAAALRPGGVLATVTTVHVSGGTAGLVLLYRHPH